MSKLHTVKPASEQSIGNVVFLHGLGGHAYKTWQHGDDESTFWPKWLADDLNDVAVYTVGYEAAPSSLLGPTMPLFDRAKNVLESLRVARILDKKTVFIVHSLGGLVFKEMVRVASTQGVNDWSNLKSNFSGVAFIGTPHMGTSVPRYVDSVLSILGLSSFVRSSKSVEELRRNEPQLRTLDEWFCNNARDIGIDCCAFYETQNTFGMKIVDEGSARLGIEGVRVVGIDADHLSIANPLRDDLLYKSVLDFVGTTIAKRNAPSDMPKDSLPQIRANPIKAQPDIKRDISDPLAVVMTIRPGRAVPTDYINFRIRQAFVQAMTIEMTLGLIDEANALVREVENPQRDEEHQYIIQVGGLRTHGPIDALWFDAFSHACALGPRMVAALLLVAPAAVRGAAGDEIDRVLGKLRGAS